MDASLLLFIVCAAALAVIWVRWRNKELAPLRRADELSAEITDYIAAIQEEGHLPTIEILGLHLASGEWALMKEEAILFEIQSHREGSYIGTRVGPRQMPLYTGRFQSHPVEQMDPVASGQLVLTNQRVLYMSDVRTVSLAWKDVLWVSGNMEAIRIASGRQKSPLTWAVANPMLWALMIRWMSEMHPPIPALPDGLTLNVSFRDDGEGRREVWLDARFGRTVVGKLVHMTR
jgi:hypothetical protein